MTYCSKTKLICDSVCAALAFKNVLGMNATIINTSKITDVTICDICNFMCRGMQKSTCDITKILKLCKKCGGRIMFFCPEGKIFVASPITYANEIIALFVLGTISICGEHTGFDIKNVWQLSSLAQVYSKGLSTGEGFVQAQTDYFRQLENNLLMDLRLKNISDFKTRISEMLYDVSLRMADDLFSAKALALTVFMLILKIAVDNKLDTKNIFGRDFELLAELKNAKYESEVEECLRKLTDGFTAAVFGKTSSRQLAINDAVSFIEEHYSEKITLQSVAAEIFMSPHYLSKAFSNETGIKFSEFLNKTRIEKAKILIENDKLGLKEIARAVGFDDQSYFSKVFKKITGISPKQYKIRITVSL